MWNQRSWSHEVPHRHGRCKIKEGILVFQRKYTLDLLKEIGFLGSKPTCTPIEANHKIGFEGEVLVDKGRYQRLLGHLIYM